jgi:hypothetical protein
MKKPALLLTTAEASHEGAIRYWQSRSAEERLSAVWERTRWAYLDQEVGIDYWPSDKRIVRLTRAEWEASEEAPWLAGSR